MLGYIIKDDRGKYLAHNRVWISHDQPEEAFVFSAEITEEVVALAENENWPNEPTHVVQAEWDGQQVKILSQPIALGKHNLIFL